MGPFGEVPNEGVLKLSASPTKLPFKEQPPAHHQDLSTPTGGPSLTPRSTVCGPAGAAENEETYSSSGPEVRKSSSDGGGSVENMYKKGSDDSKVTDGPCEIQQEDLPGAGSKRKRHHRHTTEQIEELERLFQACPHPDEAQRLKLSRDLRLEPKQVKFWFQNRRTQQKAHTERSENAVLRSEVEALRRENNLLREALKTAAITGGAPNPSQAIAVASAAAGTTARSGALSESNRVLQSENAQLKNEVKQLSEFVTRTLDQQQKESPHWSQIAVLRRQEEQRRQQEEAETRRKALDATNLALAPPQPDQRKLSSLDAGLGPSSIAAAANVASAFGAGGTSAMGGSLSCGAMKGTPAFATGVAADGTLSPVPVLQLTAVEKQHVVDTAVLALEELLLMATTDEPLWVRSGDGSREVLNEEEYERRFPRSAAIGRGDFTGECTRASGVIAMTAPALIEVLLDIQRWQDLYPCIIAKAAVVDVLSLGSGNGSRDGALLLMYAETHILSPVVATRCSYFLRYCKLLPDGSWAVVDAAVEPMAALQMPQSVQVSSLRRPSGTLIKDTSSGCSRITMLEHNIVQPSIINRLYDTFVRCGAAFGSMRWLAVLQRQCFRVAAEQGPINSKENCSISLYGRRSLFQLARRMCVNFCLGASSYVHPGWTSLAPHSGDGPSGLRILARKNSSQGGEPAGMILAASTSLWLPAHTTKVFDFLSNLRLRSQWDILSNGGAISEVAQLVKGPEEGNSVWLLRVEPPSSQQGSMLIVQESATDCFGSILVYAPVDTPAMQLVMAGGNPEYVALLPSGFIILPDGPVPSGRRPFGKDERPQRPGTGEGSLVTVAFQILVTPQVDKGLTVESVETVSTLVWATITRIKTALGCPDC